MSKVALVIPARLGSTRLARKALADIEGQAMVVRVAERASRVRHVDRVLVATDSEEIQKIVEKAGYEVRMSPESLRSGTERVAYVAESLKEEIIINLQGDEPLMAPEAVEAALDPVLRGGEKMGSAFTRFRDWEEVLQPSNVKVLTNLAGHAIYFSRSAIPFRQNPLADSELLESPFFGKHLGLYVYQRDFLLEFPKWDPPLIEKSESLEQLRALFHGVKIGMGRTEYGSISVDTQEDLDRARAAFRAETGN